MSKTQSKEDSPRGGLLLVFEKSEQSGNIVPLVTRIEDPVVAELDAMRKGFDFRKQVHSIHLDHLRVVYAHLVESESTAPDMGVLRSLYGRRQRIETEIRERHRHDPVDWFKFGASVYLLRPAQKASEDAEITPDLDPMAPVTPYVEKGYVGRLLSEALQGLAVRSHRYGNQSRRDDRPRRHHDSREVYADREAEKSFTNPVITSDVAASISAAPDEIVGLTEEVESAPEETQSVFCEPTDADDGSPAVTPLPMERIVAVNAEFGEPAEVHAAPPEPEQPAEVPYGLAELAETAVDPVIVAAQSEKAASQSCCEALHDIIKGLGLPKQFLACTCGWAVEVGGD